MSRRPVSCHPTPDIDAAPRLTRLCPCRSSFFALRTTLADLAFAVHPSCRAFVLTTGSNFGMLINEVRDLGTDPGTAMNTVCAFLALKLVHPPTSLHTEGQISYFHRVAHILSYFPPFCCRSGGMTACGETPP